MRMVDICGGVKSKNEVLAESIERYKEVFMRTKIEFEKLVAVSIIFSSTPPSLTTSIRLSAIASMGKAPCRRSILAKLMKMMTKTAVEVSAAGAVAEEGAEVGAAVEVQEVRHAQQEVQGARARHELGAVAAVEGPREPTGHHLHHHHPRHLHRRRADKSLPHLPTMRMSTVGLCSLLDASLY